MRKLEKLIINKIRNRNLRIGIQEPAVIKKLYKKYSDEEIKNLPKFDNLL